MTSESWPFWTQVSGDPDQTAEAWLRSIRAACKSEARPGSWNPSIYGHPLDWSEDPQSATAEPAFFDKLPTSWTEDLRNDLVQDVYLCLHTNHLIGENFEKIVHQLEVNEELRPNSSTQNLFQKIMKTCVQRVLLRRANKNDLTRLKRRFQAALEENFSLVGQLPPHSYAAMDTNAYGIADLSLIETLTNVDLAKGRNVLASFPTEEAVVADDERQRAPRFYSNDKLQEILTTLLTSLGKAISVEFLNQVIEHTFESLKRPISISQESERKELASKDSTDPYTLPGSDQLANETLIPGIVEEIMMSLTPREKVVLAAYSGRWGDQTAKAIAGALLPAVSRQSVEQIRDRITQKIREFLALNHPYLSDSREDLRSLKMSVAAAIRKASFDVETDGLIDEGLLQ